MSQNKDARIVPGKTPCEGGGKSASVDASGELTPASKSKKAATPAGLRDVADLIGKVLK